MNRTDVYACVRDALALVDIAGRLVESADEAERKQGFDALASARDELTAALTTMYLDMGKTVAPSSL